VVAKNGAVGGTPSAYALMCLNMMVDEEVDLVGGCGLRLWARGALPQHSLPVSASRRGSSVGPTQGGGGSRPPGRRLCLRCAAQRRMG
jgi:hypothetical protein